ncbi:MAG: hypothetical protein GY780_14205 [bacterium]|nr:hypothetical protein [bacterium]
MNAHGLQNQIKPVFFSIALLGSLWVPVSCASKDQPEVAENSVPSQAERVTRDTNRGARGELVFQSSGEIFSVILCGMDVNCCTESIEVEVTVTENGTDIMLHEIYPDLCECIREKDVLFQVFPKPEKGRLIRVFANDGDAVLGSRVME